MQRLFLLLHNPHVKGNDWHDKYIRIAGSKETTHTCKAQLIRPVTLEKNIPRTNAVSLIIVNETAFQHVCLTFINFVSMHAFLSWATPSGAGRPPTPSAVLLDSANEWEEALKWGSYLNSYISSHDCSQRREYHSFPRKVTLKKSQCGGFLNRIFENVFFLCVYYTRF